MSHLNNSGGSEDGQLRSPGDNINLSEGEHCDTADSLEIKPPQAAKRESLRKKTNKKEKHSKEHKHKDRERERDRDRDRIPTRDRGGGGGGGGGGGDNKIRGGIEERRHHHSGFRRERERHNHRREYYDQQRDYDYHNRHKQRERDKRMEQQQQQQHQHYNIRDRDRRKYLEQQYENKADAEKALEDLRSRLLSKRNKYEKDISRYDDEGHYDNVNSRSSGGQQEYRRGDYKDRKENIIEVIDSPEHYSDYTSSSSKRKEKKHAEIEDPDQASRRARLLEAERQMARRKEVAREELEARRSRRERDEPISPPEQVKPKSKRHHSDEQQQQQQQQQQHKRHKKRTKKSPKEEGEYVENAIQKVSAESDISSEEEKETESESETSSDSDVSKKDNKSVDDDNDDDDDDDGNDDNNDDALPGSPLSVGDLSKSEHRRSISKSRSRSHSIPLRSRSHSERSKSDHSRSSKSKSHTPSRSGSDERSISKSHSRSRSRSRSRSSIKISRSRSRSLSRSRSQSRSRSPRSPSRSISDKDNEIKRQQIEEDNEDVIMTELVEEGGEEEIIDEDTNNPVSPLNLDESPRDENGEKLPHYYPGIQGCRSVEEFQCLNRIEEGTYGVVYRAKDKRTNEIVALKRLKMEKEKEGFPITSLREINTLLKGQHPNIVTVREIVVGSNMDKIFIVMDYVEHDLKSLMETMKHKDQSFFPGEVKCLLQQLLKAVGHLHDNWILHRDLKTSNLLLSHKGILKVGDFGLAREYGSPLKAYTSLVVTLWYRAPELLLCAKEYSTPIDMWSVGCIFAEFLQMGPLFPGKSEIDQLNRIFKELGTPNEKIWPGYKDLPAVQNLLSQNSHFTEYPVSNLRRRFFNKASDLGIALLQGLLTYDPKQRLTAEQALNSPFFKELPLPIDPSMFPTWPAKSELGARKALASSPKPPSGGSQFKELERDEITTTTSNKTGFVLNAGIDQRQLAMGPGFNLKF